MSDVDILPIAPPEDLPELWALVTTDEGSAVECLSLNRADCERRWDELFDQIRGRPGEQMLTFTIVNLRTADRHTLQLAVAYLFALNHPGDHA